MNSLTVAVHGATGSQGSAALRKLLASGHQVRAIARNPRGLPAGVEAAPADLLDLDALVAAYTGVDAVALQLPMVFDDGAMAQVRAVLAAVEKAAVPRVVFNTSAAIPDVMIGVPFIDARVRLIAELPNVVETAAAVGPAAMYAENLAAPWSAPLVAAGEIRYPLPAETPIPWVTSDDVAAVMVEALTTATPPRVQLVGGPEDLTGDQVGAALNARWQSVTPDEYEQLMRPYVGPAVAAGVAGSYRNLAPVPTSFRRGTTTLREWAAKQSW
jgi:uncharacterized protein YbjT (DUF2867 family)